MGVAISRLEELLRETADLHKHLCPRQVLGVRTGMFAADLLGLELPQNDKLLFTFVETDGCFADGVSVATGCWLGHRTLRLIDYGKVAATFVDTYTSRAYRICPVPDSRALAQHYAPGAPNKWRAQLQGYQVAPASELLVAREVTLTVSLKSIVSKPGHRVACDCCGEDILNEREIAKEGRTLCLSCAGEGYYT
jgi:formylmethanofuran dehydrogenase subunit E